MCRGRECIVQDKLLQVHRFLEPHKPLLNAHMTSFITKNYWTLLSPELQTEAFSLSNSDIHDIFWTWGDKPEDFHKSSAIGKFLKDCWRFSLASNSFNELTLKHNKDDHLSPDVMMCMSTKKQHEVSNLKEIVGYLCECSQANCVVDVGGGKGYLGTSLVLEKKIKVLSIDSKPVHTKGAAEIFERIEKRTGSKDDLTSLYKQMTAYVTPETDVGNVAREHLEQIKECKICLTGLHTCGDLASTCLRLFCNSQDIVSVCGIGCCYNLLTEKFEGKSETSSSLFGFPLSNFLYQQKYFLGRNARMIACQSLDRILHEKRAMKPVLFWRAVLQVYLERHFGPDCDFTIGRRCSKSSSLSDYLLKAEQSLKIDLKLSEESILNLTQETEEYYDYMAKFYCFRLALAPVVETLIVLDKLMYLHEQGVDNSSICKVFDGVKSPRCYALLAVKKSNDT